MKKIAYLSLGAVILGALPFGSCQKGGSNEIENIDLVPVQISKDAWSFVDPEGKVVLEDEFKERPSLVYNGFFSVEKNDKYEVYKINGTKCEELGDLVGLKSVGYFEDGLIPVCFPKERISVYDTNGKKKFDIPQVNGKEVTKVSTNYSDGMLAFQTEEDKYGYLDKNGKVAIKASYDFAGDFDEGYALVSVYKEEDEKTVYSLIDKKGETVFKLKEGQEPVLYTHGYVIVHDSERDVLYNTKGEVTTFPSKIERIYNTDGKYVIFKSKDDEIGVADMEGEVIVRPKYDNVMFNGSDGSNGFVAWDDEESLLLDKKGEQVAKLDYERVIPFGQFGYFGKDGSRYYQIDKEGKPKSKADFYEVNLSGLSACYAVYSDYFDTAGVAKTVADLVSGNKVGSYTLGASPSSVLKDANPSSYTYSRSVTLEDLSKEGYRYEISANGYFNEYLAYGGWDYDTYDYRYQWNSDAKLGAVNLYIRTQSEWGKAGYDALVDNFKSKGFTANKEGYMNGDANAAVLSKGNIAVIIMAEPKSYYGNVIVVDKNVSGMTEEYNDALNSISTKKSESYAATEQATTDYADYPAEDYAVVEEAVAEEAW